jgi:hypothetical protein
MPFALLKLFAALQLPACAVTPTQALLPNVISEAQGSAPAWVAMDTHAARAA